jgi:hypothetical protein
MTSIGYYKTLGLLSIAVACSSSTGEESTVMHADALESSSQSPQANVAAETSAKTASTEGTQATGKSGSDAVETNAQPTHVHGFAHGLAKSRFYPGGGQVLKSEFGMVKTEGDQGVFSTQPSGMVLAISNANADVRRKGQLHPGGPAAHDLAVRDYFLSVGLPASQIDKVESFPGMSRKFTPEDAPNTGNLGWKHEFNYTMVRRQIDGIPVPDSFAWARLNEDGSVIAESAYWPDIPASVVAKAKALNKVLSDGSSEGATYVAKVNSKHVGRVVIHHTPGEWPKTFVAAESYDVPDDDNSRRPTRHFDSEGKRSQLPHEKAGAWK